MNASTTTEPPDRGAMNQSPSQKIEPAVARRPDDRDELLSVLAHDLRNPLNAIAASVEVLNRVAHDAPENLSARNIIGRQTRRLARLIDDLTEAGRLMSNEVALESRPIAFDALVAHTLSRVEARAAARSLEFVVELDPAWVEVDEPRIAESLGRLLETAIRQTAPGGGLAVRLVAAPPGEALLEVRTRQVGGATRDDRATFSAPRGGVEWLLAHRLIEKHGGRLQPLAGGRGDFALRLPSIAAPADTESTSDARPSLHARIGLIDDNADVLATLRTMLELDGHLVSTADDGPAGLEMLLREAPDIAIVDIGLPGFDGREVARRSRAGGFRGRLVALSGSDRGDDRDRSIAAGFEVQLQKPVDAERLSRLLTS